MKTHQTSKIGKKKKNVQPNHLGVAQYPNLVPDNGPKTGLTLQVHGCCTKD